MIFLFIALGSALGSFIYAAYCRFSPETELSDYVLHISSSRSACAFCHHTLSYWELMPILSWLMLRGKCAHCHEHISIGYWLIECTFGLLFLFLFWHKGININTALLAMLACWFMLLALIDYRYYLLPDFLTQPLMWLGVILAYLELTPIRIESAIISVLMGYLLLKLPALCFYLWTKKQGLGNGDIKLIAAIGAWTEYHLLPFLLMAASILGILLYLWQKHVCSNHTLAFIAFGPCLLLSGYCTIFYSWSFYH